MTYDPQQIDYQQLLSSAKEMKCTSAVYSFDEEQQKLAKDAGIDPVIEWKESLETRQVKKAEQKYYLRNTVFAYLPLTELQAVKINVAVSQVRTDTADPTDYLSERQKQLLDRIKKVLEKKPDGLAEFSFPEDQAELIDYNTKLMSKLEQLEK